MQITVSGKHHPVPAPIKQFAADRYEHLGKYLSTIQSIQVELYEDGKPKNGRGHVASVRVATSGPVFRSKAVSSDYKTAIEITLERLERRVKEFKRQRSGKPAHSRPKVQSTDNQTGTIPE